MPLVEIPPLGETIKEFRETVLGLTQEGLAKKLGCRQEIVLSWESDKTVPTVRRLFQMLALAGRSPREIFGLEKEK